jgi:hypothetical protein
MNTEAWSEEEVCQAMGGTRLYNIEGIGDVRLELFSAAGFELVRHVRDLDEDEVRERLMQAVRNLSGDQPDILEDTWRRRVALCMSAAVKIQNPLEAASFAPEHLICPITYELMTDPVVTSTGHTYERSAIERYIRDRLSAEQPALDHANAPVIPMRTTTIDPSPSDYTAPNFAVRNAIGYFKRHSMRFSILLKAPYRD